MYSVAVILKPDATAMNIILSPELENLVNEKVACGEYESADAVFAEALRLLHERDKREGKGRNLWMFGRMTWLVAPKRQM